MMAEVYLRAGSRTFPRKGAEPISGGGFAPSGSRSREDGLKLQIAVDRRAESRRVGAWGRRRFETAADRRAGRWTSRPGKARSGLKIGGRWGAKPPSANWVLPPFRSSGEGGRGVRSSPRRGR